VEVYDVLSNIWSIIEMPHKMAYHGVQVIGDSLYVVGDQLYSLNCSTMQWRQMSSMMTKRVWRNLPNTTVLDGKLFALGGGTWNMEHGFSTLNTVEMYDPQTNMWTQMADMLHKRSYFGVVVFEGKIFAIGGLNGNDVLSSVEYFCPVENKWTFCSPLTTPRFGMSVAVVMDRIYVLGGKGPQYRLDSVECLSPGIFSSSWHQVSTMPRRMYSSSACVLEERIFVTESDGKMGIYCPKENKWAEGPRMNFEWRMGLECVVIENKF